MYSQHKQWMGAHTEPGRSQELVRQGFVLQGVLRQWDDSATNGPVIERRQFGEAMERAKAAGHEVELVVHCLGQDWYVRPPIQASHHG